MNKTHALLKCCIESAEKEVRSAVSGPVGFLDEEEITNTFRVKLSEVLDSASINGKFASAVRDDTETSLRMAAVPWSGTLHSALGPFCAGLLAAVAWHPKSTEAQTAADFGIVLYEPRIAIKRTRVKELSVARRTSRGLLVQAKKKNASSSWGPLTESQRKNLRGRLGYSVLLLYRYVGERILEAFQWCPCASAKQVRKVEGWLSNDRFPETLLSGDLLARLAEAKIGTGDLDVLSNVLLATGARVLTITIDWPDDDKTFATRVRTLDAALVKAQQKSVSKEVVKIIQR